MANYTSKFTGSEIDRRLTDVDNKIPNTEKGRSNGVATLDSSGKVPTSQLPSYVDDVLEYSSRSAFPSTGEGGKLYLATDRNEIYRWTGSTYVSISSASTGGLVLGETSGTAYEGSKGKTNADDIITLQNDVANLTTGKQDKLINGTNIKTINGTSLLGSGDIPISGGGTSIETNQYTDPDTTTYLKFLKINGTNYKLYNEYVMGNGKDYGVDEPNKTDLREAFNNGSQITYVQISPSNAYASTAITSGITDNKVSLLAIAPTGEVYSNTYNFASKTWETRELGSGGGSSASGRNYLYEIEGVNLKIKGATYQAIIVLSGGKDILDFVATGHVEKSFADLMSDWVNIKNNFDIYLSLISFCGASLMVQCALGIFSILTYRSLNESDVVPQAIVNGEVVDIDLTGGFANATINKLL